MESEKIAKQWERLQAVINLTPLSVNAFAKYIGLPCGENLYRIKHGKNGISLDVAERIAAKIPEISRGWLLFGEGTMFRSDYTEE